MELIERYLQAVKFWLPKEQKQDIIAEMSEDIHSQVEEKESALGRSLNQGEVEDILKLRGRPVLVANRYQPQQFLIGPVLFPVYIFVLKIVALCYLLPWVMVWIGIMAKSPTYRAAHGGWLLAAGQAWASLWTVALIAIGLATLVFAVLEQVQAKNHFMEKWDPRKLPPVRNTNQIKRVNSIVEIVALGVFGVVWWVGYFSSLQILNLEAIRITLTPAWWYFFWAFLAANLANLTLSAFNLARPYWTVRRATLKLLIDVGGSALFCWLLQANIVAEFWSRGIAAGRLPEITNTINAVMARCVPYGILFGVAIILGDAYRIFRVYRKTNDQPLETIVALVL